MTPAGLPPAPDCPGCGQPPFRVLGAGTQAFCGNTACAVFTWNPTLALAELAAGMKILNLDFLEEL